MLDTLATQSYCGFLLKKTKLSLLNGWRLRWFELNCENCTLTYYDNETVKEPIGQYTITEHCIIEAIQDNSYPYVFRLALPDKKFDFILAAPNMSTIESWMLLLIQMQMGAIKPEENFRTGESQDAVVSALSCPLKFNGGISRKDMIYFTEILGEQIIDSPPRRQCAVMKRSIHKNSWKARHIVLENHILTMYASAADAQSGIRPRGNRSFHASSLLALLPPGFEGQPHSLALVTGNPPYTDRVSIRLSFCDEEAMLEWHDALHMEIMREVQLSETEERNITSDVNLQSYSINDDTQSLQRPSIFAFNNPSLAVLRTTVQYADFYISHFLLFQRHSKYSQIVVYENQRYVPLVGWSSANLLFTDHPKFSDLFGRRFPEPSLEDCPSPPGYKWAADELGNQGRVVDMSLGDRTMTLPLSLGMQRFEVDLQYAATDQEGWTYALSFPRMQLHLSENSTHNFRKARDFVRRRRWVRLVDINLEREL